jgi:hypothetical protein
MGREKLLEVKVGNLDVSRGCEEILKCIVEDNLTTVIRMLETLLCNVLVDELGHLRSRDEFTFWESQEPPQLRCNFLFAVEAVVLRTLLSLLTIRIFLGVLNLANKLSESLDFVAESGKFSLDSGVERHCIYLSDETFKSIRSTNNYYISL